jgi:drug/metabolite transporter (DMT)-like permease
MTTKTKGILALVVLAWVFATMGVFARYLGAEFQLFEQTYLRIGVAFLIGSLIFFPWIRPRIFLRVSKRDFIILLLRSIALYTGVVLFTESILHTTLSNSSIIASLPLLPLFGYFMLKERVALKTLLFIFIGFIGVIIVSLNRYGASLHFGYGEMMALISILAFDFSYVARRWQSSLLNNYETTVAMFLIGTIFLFITSVLLGETLPSVSKFTFSVVGIICIAGFFNVLNLVLTNYGFQHVKVAIAGNILSLEVIFALLYSIFLYKEFPTGVEVVGGILVLFSVYNVNRIESQV